MAEESPELTALLRQLADGEWHSGETLAGESGCSRAALAKRVQRLTRLYGLECEAVAGRGYRLALPLDLLDTDTIAGALSGGFRRSTVLLQTDSTNRWLLDADADDDPQLCAAEQQTAGRGRRGRSWQAPFASGLMLSVALPFDAPSAGPGALPLALGVAVAECLEGHGLAGIALKWPNDILLRSGDQRIAKLGGLLCEARGEMGGRLRIVAGLGINVRHFPALDALDQPATALDRVLPQPPARSALVAQLANALLDAAERYARHGFAAFADAFARRDALVQQRVLVHDRAPWEGSAQGVDHDGALRVQRDDGSMATVHAGDVTVRRL